MSDRNATEPRTERGHAIVDHRDRTGHWIVTKDAILAIEAEAAQGAAPRAEGLPSIEALAAIWREEEVSDLDVDCPQVDYEATAAAVLARLAALRDDITTYRDSFGKLWPKLSEGAAPRAEGLDVERLGQVIYEMGIDDLDLPDAQKLAAHILARLYREADQ